MSQYRDQHDFLGWAPAEPLEWQPEPSSWGQRPTAPAAPRALRSTPAEAAPTPGGGRPNQSRQSPTPRAETPRAPQAKALVAAPFSSANPNQQRSGRQAAPLFGIAALASGLLLLFTLMTVAGGATGGAGLGPVPLFAGIATFMVGRAAWAMRPRSAS